MGEKLASISESAEHSTVTSLTGLSSYTGYSGSYAGGGYGGYSPYARSTSGESLDTLSSSATRHTYSRNGLPGERKVASENALQQRLREKSLAQQKNYEFCKKIRVTMALIGILLLVAAIFMLSFYLPKQYQDDDTPTLPTVKEKTYIPLGDHVHIEKSHPLEMKFSYNVTALRNPSETVKPKISVKTYLGQLLSDDAKKNLSKTITNASILYTFHETNFDFTSLSITKQKFSNQCYEIYWRTNYYKALQDCFDIKSTHWFGLGEVFDQKWPLDKASFKMTPFLTSDFLDDYQPNVFGGVLEPFIINSKGGGVYIDEYVPLHVSMNENNNGKFCIQANRSQYDKEYKTANSTNFLKYTVCTGENIKEVYDIMFKKYIKKPKGVPDEQMFKKPIWSTWAKFKKSINQSVIEKFASKIDALKFEASHIEIDDQYQTKYGDYNFDPVKFPDLPFMFNIIRSYGFRITAWVFPFANLQSKTFLPGLPYWMTVGRKNILGITKWWDGQGAVLDPTNPKSREWFIKRLELFQRLKIDGFKFDAGEVNYLPEKFIFSKPQPNPNYFSNNYVRMASHFSSLSEVRVAYKTQEYPIFVRMLDRSSSWTTQTGLKSVLTTTLTFGILGYPFVLPDMVGGNQYIDKPNKELYVRWTQLCAFLPAIQFSIAPWDYDAEVLKLVREALLVRKKMSDIIYKAANDSQLTGEPIVRPLWWYWPTDHETFVVDTEFMLGKDYLIAPVLHLNIITHEIYLPAGVWEEQWGEGRKLTMQTGGFRNYNVTLGDMCYFRLVEMINTSFLPTTDAPTTYSVNSTVTGTRASRNSQAGEI